MLPLARAYPNNSCLFYTHFPASNIRAYRFRRISFLLRIYQNISRGSRGTSLHKCTGEDVPRTVNICIARRREFPLSFYPSRELFPTSVLSTIPSADRSSRSTSRFVIGNACNRVVQIDAAGKYGNHRQRQRQQRKRNCRRLFALSAPLFLAAQLIRVPLVFWRTPRLSRDAGRYSRRAHECTTATATQIKERPDKAAREIKRSMASLHRRALISPAVCIPRSTSGCLCDRGQWNTFARTRAIKKINLIPKLDRDE